MSARLSVRRSWSSFGEVLGYFDIRNKQDAEGFTVGDQEMLMALAPAASIAIQNALAYQQRLAAEAELQESYERLRALAANLELVREEERTQIARELHDQLGQALTAMKFDLAWLTDRFVQKDVTLGPKDESRHGADGCDDQNRAAHRDRIAARDVGRSGAGRLDRMAGA